MKSETTINYDAEIEQLKQTVALLSQKLETIIDKISRESEARKSKTIINKQYNLLSKVVEIFYNHPEGLTQREILGIMATLKTASEWPSGYNASYNYLKKLVEMEILTITKKTEYNSYTYKLNKFSPFIRNYIIQNEKIQPTSTTPGKANP